MLLQIGSNIPLDVAADARVYTLRTRQAGLSPFVSGRFQHGHSTVRTFVATGESASSSPVDLPARNDYVASNGEATLPDINGNGSGPEDADDGRVVTTFRWPSALGGQDVSVVGAPSDIDRH